MMIFKYLIFGTGLFFILMGVYSFVYFIDGLLPTPIGIMDEVDHQDRFVSERAFHYLENLTSIGPRPYTSFQNQKIAAGYIEEVVNRTIFYAHPAQSFSLSYQKSYEVNNIIVKQFGRLHFEEKSVLISAHYDTVYASPGAGDNAAGVAALLEILHKMSQQAFRPEHNIIYLLNGVQESEFIGSRLFLEYHKWGKQCRVVINLDSYGAGGRSALLRAGPRQGWLLGYYALVPRPYASVIFEEMFDSLFVDSNSDYSVYTDIGKLVGYDLAFLKNGFVYHTLYDDLSHVSESSLQHLGDNALSLVRSLSEAYEVNLLDWSEESDQVFYDIFGLFLISYSTRVAMIVNIFLGVLSIILLCVSIKVLDIGSLGKISKCIGLTAGLPLLSWICSMALALIFSFLLPLVYDPFSLNWALRYFLITLFYIIPTLTISISSITLLKHANISRHIYVQLQLHMVRVIWSFFLLLGTGLNVRSVYVFLAPILFHLVIFTIIYSLKLKDSAKSWVTIYSIGMVVPTMIQMNQAIMLLAFFIPYSERIDNELILSVLIVTITMVITSYVVPLVGLISTGNITILSRLNYRYGRPDIQRSDAEIIRKLNVNNSDSDTKLNEHLDM